jgi:2-keto-4-pentenoate hydratase
MMNEQFYRTVAMQLCMAEKEHSPIERLSVSYPEITVKDAYRIQLEAVKCKEEQGQAVVGKKIGFTNRAIQNP